MSFQDKVVLITGGTSGIGEVTANLFAKQGAKVVVAGRREELGSAVVDRIKSAGGEAVFVKTDVTSEEDVQNLVQQTVKHFGRIDIAFNNAGVEATGMVTDVTVEDYRKVFDINVLGVFLSMKYEIEQMLKQGGGVIVNTSSIVGHVAMPGASIYIASKHAVEGATKTAALEYAQQGIRINAVAPGATATDMIDRFAGKKGSENREALAAQHPMNRIAKAEEIAAAVAYLASDAASFTTGVSLPIDGGYLAK
ncbi:glucose 1-dehydrogenase [Bremerella alba]|uniref:2,5-dichloro-2,5-cyclohexadiene-1,4-diol dehydrogenase n=1 Tax=Bremerella alba TaxID=980252 RepID=A0A7V8V9K8_9BACT|nr:glucose 1-dehydrogenase [Bremerella alba]MBA2117161.1 2,5-dichloro-2,5-cyclohexadiene-1,4-diol dehydrogenase [Bremerella alba]